MRIFKSVSVLSVLFFSSLFSTATEFPKVVDFGSLKFLSSCASEDPQGSWTQQLGDMAYQSGFNAFNDAPELGIFMLSLLENNQIDTVVETGTFMGSTTMFFANYHEGEVHTIEIVNNHYQRAKQIFSQFPNVHCHFGSSDKVLKELLPTLQNKRTLFYLDAHWNSFWPLLGELQEIAKTHQDNCIIVIDDFKVPNRPDIAYDSYGANECSLAYIKKNLNQVLTDYTIHYLIPKDISRKAKFVAIPIKWKNA